MVLRRVTRGGASASGDRADRGAGWHEWAKHATGVRQWFTPWNRPLRMATDCSGSGPQLKSSPTFSRGVSCGLVEILLETVCCTNRLGTPSLAWEYLRSQHKGKVLPPVLKDVWACDKATSATRWLQHVVQCPGLNDVRERKFDAAEPPRVHATTIAGARISFQRGCVDLYVAGFPCSPWSPRGVHDRNRHLCRLLTRCIFESTIMTDVYSVMGQANGTVSTTPTRRHSSMGSRRSRFCARVHSFWRMCR